MLRELLNHPGMTQADKASIVLASNKLAELRQRLLGRWTPCDPKTLPQRKPGQKYQKPANGWLGDWEREKETGNA